MNKALAAIKPHKIIILIICFALAGIVVYGRPESKAGKKKIPLAAALSEVQGWSMKGIMELDPRTVKELKLDDYANQTYTNGNAALSLYIGYYLTTKKVGAAHDPLVCFPGQGWVVTGTQKGKLRLRTNPGTSISYSSMIVQRGVEKELILYWFQSYDSTSPDTFSQKIRSLWKKLSVQREDNAFVRVGMALEEQSAEEAEGIMLGFIREFYPVFLSYVRQENEGP
ncbi:MAG: exosortase C-terminal domain/associated protein EpsI [Thermodesulfobacteriota bacterium]